MFWSNGAVPPQPKDQIPFLELPHRFYEFLTPNWPPFADEATRWPMIVGKFVAPIVQHPDVAAYVFLNHGADFELRIVSSEYQRVEQKIKEVKREFGINEKTSPKEGSKVRDAFGGTRFTVAGKIGTESEAKRSELVFRFLHAGCALVIDNLVEENGIWKIERNTDPQNPLGNSFESLLHLVSNFSTAQFDLILYAGTPWSRPRPHSSVRTHL